MARDQIFISYSHKDAKWLEELKAHLKPLFAEDMLSYWADVDNINAGDRWREKIAEAIQRTKVAVLLVTHNFLDSDFIQKVEVPAFLKAEAEEGIRIIWVPVSPSNVKVTKIFTFQATHPTDRPIVAMGDSERHATWVVITDQLSAAFSQPLQPPQATSFTYAQAIPHEHWPAPWIKPGAQKICFPFAGRTEELAQIAKALQEREPVIAVIGLAGQGKSSLIGEWRQRGGAPEPGVGLCWCRAYDASYTFDLFLDDLIDYLAGAPPDRTKLPQTLQRLHLALGHLRQRPTLIVLDGVERWLRRWAADPDAGPEGATAEDRAGASPEFDLFLREASAWTHGARLLLTTRALPSALDRCRHATIGAGSGRQHRLGGLQPGAAVQLLREFCSTGTAAELQAATAAYGYHPYAINILGLILESEYGSDAARWREANPLADHDFAGLLGRALDRHHEAAPLLEHVACSLCPAPVALLAALTHTDEIATRHRLGLLKQWQLVESSGSDAYEQHSVIRKQLLATLPPENRKSILIEIAKWWSKQPVPANPKKLEELQPLLKAADHALEAEDAVLATYILYNKSSQESYYTPEDWLRVFGFLNENLRLNAQVIELLKRRVENEEQGELRNDLAMTYSNRGIAFRDQGRLAEAIADYDRAIEIRKRLVEEEGRSELRNDLADVYNNRGIAFRKQGRLAEAIEDYDQAIEITKGLVEEEGRSELRNDLAMTYNNRGNAFRAQGRLTEAIADYDRAIEIQKRLVENEGRSELRNDLAMTYSNRGTALGDQDRLDEAIVDFVQAIKIYQCLVEDEGRRELIPDLETSLTNRADAYARQESWPEALKDLETGGALLHGLLSEGFAYLLPSFLNAAAFRCYLTQFTDDASCAAAWSNDALGWLIQAAETNAVTEVLIQKLPLFLSIVEDAREKLIPAGLDTARLERVRELYRPRLPGD